MATVETKSKPKPKRSAPKPKTMTPKELAASIGISPKVLRAWLRKEHARPASAKNTSWIIPAKVCAEAKKAFAKNEAK